MPLLNKHTAQRSVHIVVIDGGNRNSSTCPGLDGKTKYIAQAATEDLPNNINIDHIDLSVKGDGVIVQPCKGCIGTAGGYHCHYPCTCYGPGSGSEDLIDAMYEYGIYDKLEKSDGFIVFSPINWYNPTTQIKAMFDRLVCINLTLTKEQAYNELDIGKDPKLSQSLELEATYDHLLENHYEGKFAAFFIHGDSGADDYSNNPIPESLKMYIDEEKEADKPKNALKNIVNMCRWSGIFVPTDLIYGTHIGIDNDYAENDIDVKENIKSDKSDLVEDARALIIRLADYITNHSAGVEV